MSVHPPDRRELLQNRRTWLRRLSLLVVTLLAYPLGRFLRFRVQARPRQVRVNAPLSANGYHADRDFLLFAEEQRTWAVSRVCTHLGCRVNYHQQEGIIECPCHQSRFLTDGTRIAGPAKDNLPGFSVEIIREAEGEGERISAYVVTLPS